MLNTRAVSYHIVGDYCIVAYDNGKYKVSVINDIFVPLHQTRCLKKVYDNYVDAINDVSYLCQKQKEYFAEYKDKVEKLLEQY